MDMDIFGLIIYSDPLITILVQQEMLNLVIEKD